MGSNTSKANCTASAGAVAITIPTIPQDIIDEILDHLATDSDTRPFRSYALVSKSWVQPCRRHLFRTVVFTSMVMGRWLKTFPVPEESPAHHVRDLCIWIGGHLLVAEKFREYTQWFTNVEEISLMGVPPYRVPLLGRLPRSATSLTINTNAATPLQLQRIMILLPNLNNLSLSGDLLPLDKKTLAGIGTVLRGDFGGRLILRDGCADAGVMNMLLEIPTGLRFTEVQIQCKRNCLPSAVRLVEACSKTLVKMSHTPVTFDSEFHPFFRRGPTDPSMRNINSDAIFCSRWPREFWAVLRLLQIPRPPGSELYLYGWLEGGRSTLDPYGSFNPQTCHLSTFIRYPTQLHRLAYCPQDYRRLDQGHRW